MAGIFLLIVCAVIIWGYIIYFSDANDCQDHPDQVFWLIIMILVLLYGLLPLLALTLILCCGPFLYCWIRQQMELAERGPNGLTDSQIPQVIA